PSQHSRSAENRRQDKRKGPDERRPPVQQPLQTHLDRRNEKPENRRQQQRQNQCWQILLYWITIPRSSSNSPVLLRRFSRFRRSPIWFTTTLDSACTLAFCARITFWLISVPSSYFLFSASRFLD